MAFTDHSRTPPRLRIMNLEELKQQTEQRDTALSDELAAALRAEFVPTRGVSIPRRVNLADPETRDGLADELRTRIGAKRLGNPGNWFSTLWQTIRVALANRALSGVHSPKRAAVQAVVSRRTALERDSARSVTNCG